MQLALALVVALAAPAPRPDHLVSAPPAAAAPQRVALAPAPRPDHLVSAPPGDAAAPPRAAGVPWLAVGAVAGATGLGLGLASAPAMARLEECTHCPPRLPPTMFAAVALNTVSLGLLAVGTSLRGRAVGSHDAIHGPSRAARVPWTALGGLVTAGGVLFVAAGLGWRFGDTSHPSPTPWTLLQVGMSSVVAGSSLLVYGLTYRKHVAHPREVRVAPQLGLRHVGLALVGRF